MDTTSDAPPAVFVSYSWTTLAHEGWVLDIATELRQTWGLDVRLDKWAVRTGGDPIAFMESMVSDPTVTKVLIVSDAEYVRKANARDGSGVGIEAQILTPQLYAQGGGDGTPSKYAVAVTEYGQDGTACIPTFYGGRIYVDMTDPSRHAERVEEIVRWAYNQPTHQPPEIGARPAFLNAGPTTGTGGHLSRALAALAEARPNALLMAEEYFDRLVIGVADLLPTLGAEAASREAVLEAQLRSASALSEAYGEAERVLTAILRGHHGRQGHGVLRRFVAQLFPLVDDDLDGPLPSVDRWQLDPLRLFARDLFRAAVAICLRFDDFEGIAALTHTPYDVVQRRETLARGYETLTWGAPTDDFALRIGALRRQRPEVLTDDELLQADFLLHIKNHLNERQQPNTFWSSWWPSHLMADEAHGRFRTRPFPVFVRAASEEYLARLATALRADAETLISLIDDIDLLGPQERHGTGVAPLNYAALSNRSHLGARS